MTDAPAREPRPDAVRIDQRVFLHDVTWDDYERLLEIRGESSVPRMTYLEGELELMSPSWYHEEDSGRLGRLIEAWSEAAGIDLVALRRWTLKRKRVKRGAEADECYVVGKATPDRFPDFVVEIIRTSGGLSKLEVYRRLGIQEVWLYEDGRLAFHALRGDRYEAVERSEVLPALDPALIERCMAEPDQPTALRTLRETLAK